MRARNLWILSMAVLAVALLLTVGYWGISRGGKALAEAPSPTETPTPTEAPTATETPTEIDGFRLSFKCYVINQGTAPKEEVRLCDQFHECDTIKEGDGEEGGELVTVREPQLLCTPAQKIRTRPTITETETIADEHVDLEGLHLKCYNITSAGPPVNQNVLVFDQFFEDGDQVKVQTAQYLCELARKQVPTPTPTPTKIK